MVVTYAKLWPKFTTEIAFDERTSALFKVPRLLYFDPVLERIGTTSVGQRLRQLDPAARECQLLILRGLVRDDFGRVADEMEFIQRLTGTQAVYLLVGGPPQPALIQILGTEHKDCKNWLPVLRQLEFDAVIQRTEARFQDSQIHYLLPSGEHAESFLRIADALQDPTEVSRFADWVAGHITRESVLVGDNGSLLPLLLMTRDRVRQFRQTECHIRTIPTYPLAAEHIEPLLDDIGTSYPATPIVFLVSVSSSGKLVRRLTALAPEHSRVLIICNAESEPTGCESLHQCQLTRLPRNAEGKCEACSSKQLIGIDPRTYERIPQISFEVRSINTTIAQQHSEFWEVVERTGAVKLHFNLPVGATEVRHHGVYLDVPALLADPWFRSRVKAVVQEKISPPDVILVPDHTASDAVIDVLLEVFRGVPVIKTARDQLSPSATKRIRQLTSGQLILVADDALVQGTTIRGLRYALYQVIQRMKASPSVRAFVCIARPDNELTFNNSANPYRDHSGLQFYYGYRIHLPSSGEENCPWCHERRLLSQVAPRLSESFRVAATKRREALDSGELSEKFLWDTEDLLGSETTKDSFFGQLGPRAAFAAATAAAQELRPQLGRDTRTGQVYVFNLATALANYFDSVLLSGMLRTLELKELYHLGQDQNVRVGLSRFPAASAYPGLVAELAWAAINKKLPSDLIKTLLKTRPKSSDNDLLLAILQWQRDTEA
jgi:hypothetical protein